MSFLTAPKLTRRKVGDQKYDLVTKEGVVVATVAKTGTHLDDYPWDWQLAEHLDEQLKAGGAYVYKSIRVVGVTDTLTAAVDKVSSMIEHYGLKP